MIIKAGDEIAGKTAIELHEFFRITAIRRVIIG